MIDKTKNENERGRISYSLNQSPKNWKNKRDSDSLISCVTIPRFIPQAIEIHDWDNNDKNIMHSIQSNTNLNNDLQRDLRELSEESFNQSNNELIKNSILDDNFEGLVCNPYSMKEVSTNTDIPQVKKGISKFTLEFPKLIENEEKIEGKGNLNTKLIQVKSERKLLKKHAQQDKFYKNFRNVNFFLNRQRHSNQIDSYIYNSSQRNNNLEDTKSNLFVFNSQLRKEYDKTNDKRKSILVLKGQSKFK